MIVIIIGCIILVWELSTFLFIGELLPDIFIMLGGLLWIILGVFIKKGGYNKIFT